MVWRWPGEEMPVFEQRVDTGRGIGHTGQWSLSTSFFGGHSSAITVLCGLQRSDSRALRKVLRQQRTEALKGGRGGRKARLVMRARCGSEPGPEEGRRRGQTSRITQSSVTGYMNSNIGKGNLRTNDLKASTLKNLWGKDGGFKISGENWESRCARLGRCLSKGLIMHLLT